MPMPIMSFWIGPNGYYIWRASSGEEIIDPINQMAIDRIDSCESMPWSRQLTVLRNDDGSLELPDGIWVWLKGDACGYLTPLESKITMVLPEPEFDLDEIELAEKLVANG